MNKDCENMIKSNKVSMYKYLFEILYDRLDAKIVSKKAKREIARVLAQLEGEKNE